MTQLQALNWRTSSRSQAQGANCVEVAFVPDAAAWRKSSRSQGAGANCVEVAHGHRRVATRDSKNPTGPTLVFDRPEWTAFLADLKRGAFDQR